MKCFEYIIEWLRPCFQRDKSPVMKEEEPYFEI